MRTELVVQNLKCGGCASTIKKGLMEIEFVTEVNVDVDKSLVIIEMTEDCTEQLRAKLGQLAYPVVDDPNSIITQAKSYVSCMIGKVSGN
jgi:copper chaperone